jgi:membrane protease YdiL (CAAX protease family)
MTALALRERRIPVLYALLLYGSMAVAAMIWIHFAGVHSFRAMVVDPTVGVPLAAGAGAGLFFAAAAAGLGVTFPTFRDLEAEFAQICADQRWYETLSLALLSGIGEELFFRGAMQQALTIKLGTTAGILATSLVFALFHVPMTRKTFMWPAMAFAAGVVLGYLLHWTGSLVAPIVAHVVVNAVGLGRIARRYGTPKPEHE